jgi:hypothetical protein
MFIYLVFLVRNRRELGVFCGWPFMPSKRHSRIPSTKMKYTMPKNIKTFLETLECTKSYHFICPIYTAHPSALILDCCLLFG